MLVAGQTLLSSSWNLKFKYLLPKEEEQYGC